MKKSILMIACIFTTFAHTMEIVPETNKEKNIFEIVSHGTTVRIMEPKQNKNPDSTLNISAYNTTHKNEQLFPVGTILIYREDKRPCSVSVLQPCLSFTDEKKKIFQYCCIKKATDKNPTIFIGDEAIHEASKDLKLCYEKLFSTALEELKGIPQHSLAMTNVAFAEHSFDTTNITLENPLGITVGFSDDMAAKIAIESTLEFIQKNSSQYNIITFCIKPEKFELYKKLLLEKTATENK